MRIVSLLPSSTEISFAIGIGDEIVGVSHECDFPEEAKTKPVLTRSRINPHKSSDEIDEDVVSIVKKGLSVYDIDEDKLRELQPDLILTQDQCEVCAVSLKDVQHAVRKFICSANIVSLKPTILQEILESILTIGRAANKETEAGSLIESLKSRIGFIKNKTKKAVFLPKVCCIEWLKPIFIAGNWTPELVEIAGGIDILGKNGEHSNKVSLKEILEEDPDKLIISPCGFKIYQTINDLELLTSNPQWNKLKAVKNNEVYIVDGNSYFNRPSQRIVDTLEILASLIHPELFSAKRELAIRIDELRVLKKLTSS